MINAKELKFSILRIFWAYFSIFTELRMLYSRKIFLKEIRKSYHFVGKEWYVLFSDKTLSEIKTMVLVGGGPFAYTALFHRKHFEKVIVIEKNYFVFLVASRILSKIKNIVLLHEDGRAFEYPEYALVFISLLAEGKNEIIHRVNVLSPTSHICLRIPLEKTEDRYENILSLKICKCFIESKDFGLKSVLLD